MMKRIKITAVALVALILVSLTAPLAFAETNDVNYYAGLLEGVIDTEKFKEIMGGLINGDGNSTGNAVNLTNISSILTELTSRLGNSYNVDEILAAASQVLGEKVDISKLLSGQVKIGDLLNSDVLASIKAILSGETTTVPEPTERPTEPPTTEPATEPTTEPEEPTTLPEERPTEAPTRTQYVPSRSEPDVYTFPTTEDETNFEYIPPEKITVPVLSDENTTYNVYDNNDGADGSVTVKMVIGIVILVLSGAAVAVVAVILKKSRV